MKRSLQVLYCQLLSILLILALTEEVAFAVQAPPPSLASPLGLLTDSINTISAMGTTPQQKGRRMSKLSTTATLASFRLTSSVTTFSPAMDQETPTSSHLVGIKEPYHLYNQSALFSGKTRPKGNVFQIVKGGFTEFADPYLKTELHSPPTLRNWSPSQPLQPQPSSHSNDHSTVLVSTTVTSLHSETLESLNTAVKGSSLEQVTQEMDITTSVTGPSTAPEIVTVPFKPPHYGIWDIPGKNNSWVASRQSTDQIPFFASPGTATTASALGHSNQPGVDTGVPLHVTGNPNGTSSTMHPSGDDANFPSSTLSTEPSTWLPSSTSTATGNFLNRLVPAGTRKPGHPGNISHVTEGDKPQHRATICLSKVDIAWIILAISVPISSCSCYRMLEEEREKQLPRILEKGANVSVLLQPQCNPKFKELEEQRLVRHQIRSKLFLVCHLSHQEILDRSWNQGNMYDCHFVSEQIQAEGGMAVLLTVCCMRRKKKTSNPENNLSYWNNAITMDYFNRHAVELPREIQSLETSEDHLSEPRSPANGDYRDTGMVLVNPFCQETLFVGHEQVSEI